MARVKVTGIMDPEDMGRFHDPVHVMGITEDGYLNAEARLHFTDMDGAITVRLDEVEFEAVD